MYFTIGGRRVQSGLYRVSYVGSEPTAPVSMEPTPNAALQTRHTLEAFHGRLDLAAIDAAWPFLSDEDRFIRFAARTAIEHQPIQQWSDRALNEPGPAKRVTALLALARAAGDCPQHRESGTAEVDAAMRQKLLESLLAIDSSSLDRTFRMSLVRTIQIVLNRFGMPNDSMQRELARKLDPLFPAKTPEENWLLCETLAYLESPSVASKAIALIESVPTQEEQMQYARSIRMLKAGWTPQLRESYFEWFLKAANYRGGASFGKFIEFIRNDSVASLSEDAKASMAELLARKPDKKSVLENLGEVFAGRESKQWTLDELSLIHI